MRELIATGVFSVLSALCIATGLIVGLCLSFIAGMVILGLAILFAVCAYVSYLLADIEPYGW